MHDPERAHVIRTPDQRLRVFVSSTLGELSAERNAVRDGIERLHLSPVMFELGARPYAPRDLYRAYLQQSNVFVGIYWQRYGWVAPGELVSGLEDEYGLSGAIPRLVYIKEPSPEREERLVALLERIKDGDQTSYKRFSTAEELTALVENDLAVLLAERFEAASAPTESDGPFGRRLPATLTSTVGRESDVTAIAALLESGRRLLTLTGPGGVGKTRLALEAAHHVADRFPGGTYLVALAAISDRSLIAHAIAERLEIAIEGTKGPIAAIANRISGRRTLLVLDNLEQIPHAGNAIVVLLEESPDLHVLGTSRESLRVRGERSVPVVPLPVPDAGLPFSSLEEQPAVRLFAERARDTAPEFTVTETNAHDIVELCRLVDGLPLAIELAAAHIRLFSPAALVDRIEGRIDELGSTAVDLPPRQQTLRRTIDWSHELLSGSEQLLFARLSIFAGGFSLEAVEQTCRTSDGTDVLETLSSLLNKNLISVADDTTEGEPRFQMLETLRTYARERLDRRRQTELMRRRHLTCYRALAERAQPFLCGVGQRTWVARLDPELANLRAAVRSALDFDDDAAVIELAWDVIVFYFVRGTVREPERWLEDVAARGRIGDGVIAAKLRSLLALMRIHRGEYDGARDALRSSLELFRSEGMDFESAVTLKELAWVHYLVDADIDAAIEFMEESSRLFAGIGHDWGVALVELQLGSVLAATSASELAVDLFKRSLELSRRIDNRPLMAQALQNLAVIDVRAGRDAIPAIESAVQLIVHDRHETEAASCLDALAAVAYADANHECAARAITVANHVRTRLGVRLWPSTQLFVDDLVRDLSDALGADAFDVLSARSAEYDLFGVLGETLHAVMGSSPRTSAQL